MLYQCNTNMGKANLNQGKYSSWQIDNLHVARVIKVNNKITEQSYKGKVKTHNYINRQNQSTTGKLWKP